MMGDCEHNMVPDGDRRACTVCGWGVYVSTSETHTPCTVTYPHHPHLVVSASMRSITHAPECPGIAAPAFCGALHDGVPRETSRGVYVFACTLPRGHAGAHEDDVSDSPSTLSWGRGA